MADLREYLLSQSAEMIHLLTQLVNLESHTIDKAGVDSVGDLLASAMRSIGADVTIIPQSETGNHVYGVWNCGGGDPILLLLHMDTVHPKGSVASRPVRIVDGILYGPGCCDMKASHVIALSAIKALQVCNGRLTREVRILFTSDEETGSHTSRELIESCAQEVVLTMVMEPALPDGRLKSSRKGVGEFRVTAHGKAAHAGGAHQSGVNAIEELAHQILYIQKLTDYGRGVTLSVGDIRGGGVVNVVPDTASCIVDVRVQKVEDSRWIAEKFRGLVPVLAGASLTIEGEMNRPPMECDKQRLAVIKQICAIGASIGVAVEHGASGGGSDASFTANHGIPTMDGFGAVGDGLHALDEHVILSSIPERSHLVAAILNDYVAD